jgi:phenylacetate-CoA ligase
MHVMPVATDIAAQAYWLAGIDPHYVLSYPSNLLALLRVAQKEDLHFPRLREIRCFGETVSDSLRQAALQLPGVRLTDLYSAQEVGVIALQCLDSGLYHIQAENLLVEVLDDNDAPCRAGETGRVVITDLHNYATPLIRYELGDYAEVGPVCPCGRGLPTLSRIFGRRRNLLCLPNGQRHWPHLHADRLQKALPGLRQWQLVQHTLQQIEVRLVVREAATSAQENALTALIHEELRYPFALRFRYQHDDMTSRGGKFEAFVCAMDAGGDEASDPDNLHGNGMSDSNTNGGLWHER